MQSVTPEKKTWKISYYFIAAYNGYEIAYDEDSVWIFDSSILASIYSGNPLSFVFVLFKDYALKILN